MITEPRPPPIFVADSPGLDVVNTLAAPSGQVIEWLANGEDLLAWLEQARLLPATIGHAMRSGANADRLDAAAAEVRQLRDQFRTFVTAHMGKPLGAEAVGHLDWLNRVLAQDDAYGAIVATAAGPCWQWQRRWRDPEALVLPIAQAMADVVCDADFTRIKHCEGSGCTVLFLDTTKAHARRWCSMAACGNRAKQAAHRARTRSVPPD